VTGDLPLDKLERAVALSADKYCSIGAMLRGTAQITHEIKLNGGNG
jgi:putative redox protein